MNDRHPSGTVPPPAAAPEAASTHFASHGEHGVQYGDFTTYDAYTATGFDAAPTGIYDTYGTPGACAAPPFEATTSFETDPLFGDLPGSGATGSYTSTGSHQTLNYDPYAAQHHAAYDTGGHDATGLWTDTSGHQPLVGIPAQSTGPDISGQWDANAWLQAEPFGQAQQWNTQTFDSGAYDATAWNSDGGEQHESSDQHEPHEPHDQSATAIFEPVTYEQQSAIEDEFPSSGGLDPDAGTGISTSSHEEPLLVDGPEELAPDATAVLPAPRPGSRTASRAASRSRRRTPPKRSALLTVAVPSACVMGVAGIAAASVGSGNGNEGNETTAATGTTAVQPATANNKLDTQLESLTADADDFADRASRTQERIDLKAQQEAEKKRAAAEAARKERLRPKFAVPVEQKGLSAYYGQAGINWMSVHTGIDFPVSYGTTVMAATDGVVRTEWNSAYGNMAIVTAKDGTETWYCHLSTYKVASGTEVKAGDPIAFSGNSGNSTGPHLHFEVRPGGGDAIDPLSWLRSHGLNPT
ncbi:M23 family metallopeptidase [Streptomyces sp. NPDC006365]|uniref:M23 family metallopeptidase n=1 Tax=Streptomyces sp. NPDC006365 TaxID=3364744 RepID=UPI0036CB89FA